MTPSKRAFLDTYRAMLKEKYPWAATDPERLDRFMASVETTIRTERSTWVAEGEIVTAAWRAIGCKGKITYKGLRALPDEA